MRKNLPVSQREQKLPEGTIIFSMTDLKGRITYINREFVEISGFSEEELLGQAHNIVRHPDMPPEAFGDLWKTLADKGIWSGIVKNRCKNGDHYWVRAIAMPIHQSGKTIGYQSVRLPATEKEIHAAENLYKKGKNLPSGKIVLKCRKAQQATFLVGTGFATSLAGLALMALGNNTVHNILHLTATLLLAFGFAQMYGSVFKPLVAFRQYLNRIATGDLKTPYKGEHLFRLEGSFIDLMALHARFKATVDMMVNANDRVESAIADLNIAAENTLRESTRQNELVALSASQLEETHESVKTVSRHTEETARISSNVSSMSSDGALHATEAMGGMDKLIVEVTAASQAVAALGESSREVSSFVSVIRDVAEQTNLLALNAAIEAARAGETGRGFAVVADEVRNLASKTQDETSKIETIISRLQGDTTHVVNVMQQLKKNAEQGSELVEQAAENLGMISGDIRQVAGNAEEVAQQVEEQSSATSRVLEHMGEVREASALLIQTAEKTKQHAESLGKMTSAMHKFIEPMR